MDADQHGSGRSVLSPYRTETLYDVAGGRRGARNQVHQSAREFVQILNRVADDQEIFIVRRKGSRDVALVPAAELAGLMETAHLLRSPRNATRLLSALRRAEAGKGQPALLEELRRENGLESAG
jgi:antitoxin YefM